MKANDQISYYCFTKTCPVSVYACDSVEVVDLPFTEETLTTEHRCEFCNHRLVSAVDIELKQAMAKKPVGSRLIKYAVKV
ncbi:hypothetical protein [Mucilaginibacter myungsuensis]|uniref:Uncharacterized protein n=1 Tax=Mucilaginibacter myungsuensis TaxID=649104 RepID=A0A929KVX3_9SPHI|nr:hypothetical protein [Mucilaginibacter myungsuensis]MBE9660878.1 hypothetical protein [Mucilaginibacter myungsuensis]MDN3600925.1 hypothetical protein [Mucilaginibacter myungsuensis]